MAPESAKTAAKPNTGAQAAGAKKDAPSFHKKVDAGHAAAQQKKSIGAMVTGLGNSELALPSVALRSDLAALRGAGVAAGSVNLFDAAARVAAAHDVEASAHPTTRPNMWSRLSARASAAKREPGRRRRG